MCAKTFEPADPVDAKAGLVLDELPEPWGEGVSGRGWTEGGQFGNLGGGGELADCGNCAGVGT